MISEFELLADKVSRLAELTHTLRLENAALRRAAVEHASDNKDLRERLQLAATRVEGLLAQLPSAPQDVEKDAA